MIRTQIRGKKNPELTVQDFFICLFDRVAYLFSAVLRTMVFLPSQI